MGRETVLNSPGTMWARVVFQDQLGVTVAIGAALVLGGVLFWHFLSMYRQGRLRHWTCWAAAVVACAPLAWLVALAGGAADGPWSRLALLTLLAVAAAIIFYHSVYGYLGPARVSVLLALRCVAIAVLVFLLFKPEMVERSTAGDRPMLVLMLDRSQSMNEADADLGGRTRLQAALEAVAGRQARLERHFDVRYVLFDQSVQSVDRAGFAKAAPEGPGTHLDTALTAAAPLLVDQRAKGVVLISDGIHNGAGSAAAAAANLPKPLWSVCVGGKVVGDEGQEGAAGRDVALERVSLPDQLVSKNVATAELSVHSSGYAGRTIRAVLREAGGGPEVASADVTLADGSSPVKLEFTPRQVGLMELDVELGVPDEGGALRRLEGESVAANNRHTVAARVGEQQIKVFYLEGSIRPEYRYLTQALAADPQIELMTMIQMRPAGVGGTKAAEFKVHGTVGGKSLGGMPVTLEQFKLFDVFMIGDLDRTYLSDEQLRHLQQCVQDGKGLLMIGGSRSFGPGGYAGTTVEQMLPVELGPRTIGQETMPFQLQLTPAGRVHPIFAALADIITPPPGAAASQLPQLTGCVKVARVKPAGQVLAVHPARQTPDGGSPLPVLTVHSYGGGRAAAFTADTTWKWTMYRSVAAYEAVHPRFWGQLIRWLASSQLVDRKLPAAVVVNLERSYFAPSKDAIEVTARVWDSDGQPADAARVAVQITRAGGKPSEQPMPPAPGQAGLYTVRLPPQQAGTLELAVSAHKSGRTLGTVRRRVEVALPAAELARRSADPELLAVLAGRHVSKVGAPSMPLSQYSKLIDDLVEPYEEELLAGPPQRNWPGYDEEVLSGWFGKSKVSRWDVVCAGAMLLFVVLLTGEWLLRRHWQLQ